MNENEKVDNCAKELLQFLRKQDPNVGFKAVIYLLMCSAQGSGNKKDVFIADMSDAWDFYEKREKNKVEDGKRET